MGMNHKEIEVKCNPKISLDDWDYKIRCKLRQAVELLWQTSPDEEVNLEDSENNLNSMVRGCYITHLEKILTQNLQLCSPHRQLTEHEVKHCASVLELQALRSCMVASLYQKAMAKLTSDVKRDTEQNNLHPKLRNVLMQGLDCQAVKSKQIQTEPIELFDHDAFIPPKAIKSERISTESSQGFHDSNSIDALDNTLVFNQHESDTIVIKPEQEGSVTLPMPLEATLSANVYTKAESNYSQPIPVYVSGRLDMSLLPQPNSDIVGQTSDLFSGRNLKSPISVIDANGVVPNVNDQILHNGKRNTKSIKKQLTNSELEKQSLITQLSTIDAKNSRIVCSSINSNKPHSLNTSRKFIRIKKRKIDTYVHEDKKVDNDTGTEALLKILESDGDDEGNDLLSEVMNNFTACKKENIPPDKYRLSAKSERHGRSGKLDISEDPSVWTIEKYLHQRTLHDSIKETCTDLIAREQILDTFFELFGDDSDDDEIWCSEKQVSKYREQIAPWVVKHLMPFYKEKRISSRILFKTVARHIADKILGKNHTPDEREIEKGITLFFSYHGLIASERDIWSEWSKHLYSM